jgi:pimeloyl-ACP methyl ester carboxylesterase
MRALAFIALMAAAGCVTHVAKQCPTCAVVDARAPRLPPLKPDTERLFVLVPGLLGYGWEWDAPVARLRKTPKVDFVVFWWEPWGSVDRAARELDDVLSRALASAPPSVREIVVVAHSAGGLVAAHAVGRLSSPPRKLTLVTIGAPFAGMHICPWSEVDILHAPLMLSVAAVYHRYPPPPAGVDVIEYITSWPADPVMQPHWGTVPSRSDVGPAGARRIAVDPKLDHNFVIDRVMNDLLPR